MEQDTQWHQTRAYINTTARKVGWSAQLIANQLSLDQPKLFGHINKGTIQKWINKETKHGWSKVTVKNVKQQHALAGTGQTGILAKYPDIVSEIATQLHGL